MGFRKLVCYEALPIPFSFTGSKFGSIEHIISPLVSLMMDQVWSLPKCGVGAAILSRNKGSFLKLSCLLSSDTVAVRQGLHTYEGNLSPSAIATNSSRLRCPGRSSLSAVVLNNAEEYLGGMSNKQIQHLLRLLTTLSYMDIAHQ